MRTYIAEYDLNSSIDQIKVTLGYTKAVILIRDDLIPIGRVFLDITSSTDVILRSEIENAINTQLLVNCSTKTKHHQHRNQSQPNISVIVCTRNREHHLKKCLNALLNLDYQNYEVIVIDNASNSAATKELVEETSFQYVRENIPGLDWARNRGIKEAKHEIVAFIDDDAIADRNWLNGIARGFSDPCVTCVTGLVLPAELETLPQHLFEKYGDGMSKGFDEKQYHKIGMSPVEILCTQYVGVGTNMAMKKNTIKEIGGFDTALDVGTPSSGAGDLDIFYRIINSNNIINYQPCALVWHHHRKTISELQRQIYNNGRSYGVYLIKRWSENNIKRHQIIWYSIATWAKWLIGRLLLSVVGLHRLPIGILWSELNGAMSSPWAYFKTYQNDQKLRKENNIR